MSDPIPSGHSFLRGNFAPWPMEGDVRDCAVEGSIPRELNGAYYRNGPNPQFAPRGDYHWFDGDGMIHGFFFEDGRCDYRNRWVRTERFERERQAGRALFGGLRDMTAGDPTAEGVSSNAANTNIVWHAGRLLALWEGGPPHELDPRSLETKGLFDFDGSLVRRIDPGLAGNASGIVPGIMTAHPKIDPDTGDMHCFGYAPIPPHFIYMVVDRSGRMLRSEAIDVPFPSMVHDFVVTDSHVVIPIFPAVFDLAAIAETGSPLVWRPELGTHIGVMPIGGGNADVVWLESDPCYVFHPMNARSEGSRVVAEVVRYPKLPFFGVEDAGGGSLWRWTLDLASGTVKEEPLDDTRVEFPRFDERRAGKRYRHGYAAGGRNPLGDVDFDSNPALESVVHYDLETGQRKLHTVSGGDSLGEPVFVPRSPEAGEADGFVLALCHRAAENRSDLLILDAGNVDGEPLATVKLPHRVPYGFHGNWRPAV